MTTTTANTDAAQYPYQILLRSTPPTTSPLWWEFCRSRTHSSSLNAGGGLAFGKHLGQASFLLGREIERNGSAVLGSWPTEEECREVKAWLDDKMPELKCELMLPPKRKEAEETRKEPAKSRETSEEIQRLYDQGLISQEEYEMMVQAHEKFEKETNSDDAGKPSASHRRIPDVYDAYAHRLNPTYWANHRLYDANVSYMQCMSLMEFCRKFAVPQKGRHIGKIKYHKNGVITKKLQFQPQYSSDPNFEGGRDYGQYCRFALVRYRPWVDAPFGRVENGAGRLIEHTPRDEECIRQWKDHLLELRERMHLVPDVLLPEELKGGGAGIELLVVPVVERADEVEEVQRDFTTGHGDEELDDNDEEDNIEETSICLSSVMEPEGDECSSASHLSTAQDIIHHDATDNGQTSASIQNHAQSDSAAESSSLPPQDQSTQTGETEQSSVDNIANIHENISSQVTTEYGAAQAAGIESSPRNEPIQPSDANESPRGIDEELNLSVALESLEKGEKASTNDPTLSVSYAFETDKDQKPTAETDQQLSIIRRRSSLTEKLNENASTPEKPGEVDTDTATSTSSERSFVQSSWDETSVDEKSSNGDDSGRSTASDPPSASGPDEWGDGFHDDTDNFDQKVDIFFEKEPSALPQESEWETFDNVDFPTRTDLRTTGVWNTRRSFFMASPSSPTRKLAPSRRDRASSPCRSPCRISNAKTLLDRADVIIQKADHVEREYHGDVSQIYKKIQDAKRAQASTAEVKKEHPHELFDSIEQAGDGLFGPAAFFAAHPKPSKEEKHLLKSNNTARSRYH